MAPDPSVIAAMEAAVAAAPDDVALRAHLAGLLAQAGDHDGALAQAVALLALDPAHVAGLQVAAQAAAALGQADRAAGYHRLLDALGGAADPPAASDAPARLADGPALEVPETVEELVSGWGDTAAPEEPVVGDLSRPRLRMADVGGMAAVKARLEASFFAPLRNPEIRATFGKSLRGGLLLWGPPGCGKTTIARAAAGELGASFYEVGLSDVLDMWVGSSERNLQAIFDVARRNRPCVLFFDELDALGQKRTQLRGAAMRGVVNQLLAQLDGASSDNDGLFVLGATNHPWDVDSALLRPGRFDRMLLVLPPDAEARAAILSVHLRSRPVEQLDLRRLARASDGLTGADLALVVEEATEEAMAASMQAGTVRPITQRQVEQALSRARPSTEGWFETARNYATFASDGGAYDELLTYLSSRKRRR